MNILTNIVLATSIISLISLVGVSLLYIKERLLDKILIFLVAFSAGVLLGNAFLDLLPEVISEIPLNPESLGLIFSLVLLGFVSFFTLEQTVFWHHCHRPQHDHQAHSVHPVSLTILISDGLHNLIDGVAIAAAFIVSPALGISTTVAVSLHEIPQELGDFGVLLFAGLNKTKAILANFLSALTAIGGGLLGYYLFTRIDQSIIWLLPFTAGNFIYIAAADLIPEIKRHHNHSENYSFGPFFFFLAGLALVWLLPGD